CSSLPTCPSLHHGILRDDRSTNKRPVCLPSSVSEPAHRFARFYHFTPFCPALDCASLHGCDQSLPQRLPGLVKTHRAAMFAQLDVPLTIPIDDRHCFTHRFSPTGFILNASDSNCCRPIALGSHSG